MIVMLRRVWGARRETAVIVLVCLAGIAINGAYDASSALIRTWLDRPESGDDPARDGAMLAAFVVSFVVISWIVIRSRVLFRMPLAIRQSSPPERSRVLVFLVSSNDWKLMPRGSDALLFVSGTMQIPLPTGSIGAALRGIAPNVLERWNWAQVLRGLEPHADTVQRIYLVGSTKKPGSTRSGSEDQLKHCETLVRHFVPRADVKRWTSDFTDFNQLRATFLRIIEDAAAAGHPASDVMVDATGGMKSTSIAAGSVTLGCEASFQLVDTGSDDVPRVNQYDVVAGYEPPSTA